VVASATGGACSEPVRLVKGSHIVVDRIFNHDRAFLFQNADGRVCFAVPFQGDYTLIGTTDEDFAGDPESAAITDAEADYLLDAVGRYLERPIPRASIRWTYAGVRVLPDGGGGTAQSATRDYRLALDAPEGQAPMLSVIGGKLTTHRSLAERVLKMLAPSFPEMAQPWTSWAALPGGDMPGGDFATWAAAFSTRYPFLDAELVRRLCSAYGTRVEALLDGVTSAADLGKDFGAGLTEREVDYLVQNEWAVTAEDILWRRTKLGLRAGRETATALAAHLGGAFG
jgi:glycerol-3-phosphate dehydrogenase